MAKYEVLAHQLKEQIERGVWVENEELPSLRKQAAQTGFSLMTVLHAYQMLESQGIVSSQERSGFLVTAKASNASKERVQATEAVSINDFVYEVLQASRDPYMFSLGFAYPDPSLYPRQHLNKSIAAAAQRISLTSAMDNLPPGNLDLRKIIAKRYAAKGMNISPDEIIITAGALEALNLSLQACTTPGDWVVVESPVFYGTLQALQRLGLKAITVTVSPNTGLDVAALERAFKNHNVKACWLMSNFQNPVGYSLSDVQKQQVAALLDKYNVALIEDDVYAELYADKRPPLPIKHFMKEGDSMLCSSFSKSLVAGYRIGWVAAGKRALEIQKQQLMSTLATSAPIQLALVDYLSTKNYESHLKQLRKKLITRKKTITALLTDLLSDVATIHTHSGGYFLWVECRGHVDAMAIYKEALRLHITIAPGKLFSLTNEFNHCFRLNASFALNEAKRNQLLKLSLFIKSLS
ncbi:aminotransferase-like domain-containing protein [Alteromonas macleodii]|uniref:aminotransferase-like domain-containing protein n=1 Tax=Alteromonas macleodii TaxID=28108 RepID=UPI00313A8149